MHLNTPTTLTITPAPSEARIIAAISNNICDPDSLEAKLGRKSPMAAAPDADHRAGKRA